MNTTDPRAERRARLEAAGALEMPPTTHERVAVLEGDYQPTVPARVRDGVYWATLGTAAASALAAGIAGIWFPDIAAQVVATGGVATTVMGIIGGGVGVVYRPGAQR
jgi:hypothetical protein